MITRHGLPGLGGFLGPGQRDVQGREDHRLGRGEPVEDETAGGVGGGQAVEGGQGGAGGGDGGAAFGQDAGQRGPGPECVAQLGFDEPEDEQRDADDGDEGGDAVVVVQEDGPDLEGLLQVAVPLLDGPLVFVDLQHVHGGQRRAAGVGQVGGQCVQPVEAGGGGGRVLVGWPGGGGPSGPWPGGAGG